MKIFDSLFNRLMAFAVSKATHLDGNGTPFIMRLLSKTGTEEEEYLAIEGYRFYAKEASEFAETSAPAVAEALPHGSQARRDILD
jgi:hypothetical protein